MPRHHPRQPVERGLTLVELVVGIAAMSVITLVLAGLFKAGLQSYRYALRQNLVLANARKAIEGDGRSRGILWNAQAAQSLALSSGSVTLSLPSQPSLQYLVSDRTLLQSQMGTQQKQADGVTGLQSGYYNLDGQGRIMQSTAAASAAMVATTLTMQGRGEKTYVFFSGAGLRNRP